jgi:hypothetical protein
MGTHLSYLIYILRYRRFTSFYIFNAFEGIPMGTSFFRHISAIAPFAGTEVATDPTHETYWKVHFF